MHFPWTDSLFPLSFSTHNSHRDFVHRLAVHWVKYIYFCLVLICRIQYLLNASILALEEMVKISIPAFFFILLVTFHASVLPLPVLASFSPLKNPGLLKSVLIWKLVNSHNNFHCPSQCLCSSKISFGR